MSKTFYIVAAVVAVVLLGGLVFTFMRSPVASTSPESPESVLPPNPEPVAAPPAPTLATGNDQILTPPSAPMTVTITYTDSGFSPSALTIKAGTTVTFKNQSSERFWPASNVHPSHAAYDGTTLAEHCQNPKDTTFDACRGLPPGSLWSFAANKVGTWSYHDHLNPGARGTITVN